MLEEAEHSLRTAIWILLYSKQSVLVYIWIFLKEQIVWKVKVEEIRYTRESLSNLFGVGRDKQGLSLSSCQL